MKKILISFFGLVILISGSFFGVQTASAVVDMGKDPQTSGCGGDAYDVGSWVAYDYSGAYQATVELRYSPKCGTNWVRVTQQNAAYSMNASIRLDKPNGTYTGNGDFARGYGNGYASWWTGMVNAPGNTCVLISVSGNSTAAQTLNWSEKKVC